MACDIRCARKIKERAIIAIIAIEEEQTPTLYIIK
jgi:hypothetical protein